MFSADVERVPAVDVDCCTVPAAVETGEVLFPGLVLLAFGVAGVVAARRRTAPRRIRDPSTPPRVVAFYATITALAAWSSFGPDGGLYTVLAKTVPSCRSCARRRGSASSCSSGSRCWRDSACARGSRADASPGSRRCCSSAIAVEVKAKWGLLEVPPVPEAYRTLARLPPAPVVEFHFPYKQTDLHNHARYMFWSMWHWRPLVNGYSDFIS